MIGTGAQAIRSARAQVRSRGEAVPSARAGQGAQASDGARHEARALSSAQAHPQDCPSHEGSALHCQEACARLVSTTTSTTASK